MSRLQLSRAASLGLAVVVSVAMSAPDIAQAQLSAPQPSTPSAPRPSTPGLPRPVPQPDIPTQLKASSADPVFVKEAVAGSLTEVALGRLAVSKGSQGRVKEFAERMIADHSKAAAELQAVASRRGWEVEKEAPKDAHAELHAATGSEFERLYAETMVKAHERTIAKFEDYAEDGSDTELKAWVAKALPTVREHLRMAKALQAG